MERRVYELDGLCELVAATVKRAVLDARRGDQRAEYFLDDICPRWRQMTAQEGAESKKNGHGYIDAH